MMFDSYICPLILIQVENTKVMQDISRQNMKHLSGKLVINNKYVDTWDLKTGACGKCFSSYMISLNF